MNNTYFRKLAITLLFLTAAASTGCATMGPVLDSISDPRIMNIINTVRELVHDYRIRLQDPNLESIDRTNTLRHFDQLARDIEVQLDLLESYGYPAAAAYWRAEMDLPPNGHS